MSKTQTNTPFEIIRDGAIKATLWENQSENGSYLTITFARTFTKDNTPQDTNTFLGRDLLVVAELARQAYDLQKAHRLMQKIPS